MAANPFGGNDTDTQLLREIEYNQRLWAWGNTEESKDKTTAPEPLPLPGEKEASEREAEHTRAEALDVAAALGVDI